MGFVDQRLGELTFESRQTDVEPGAEESAIVGDSDPSVGFAGKDAGYASLPYDLLSDLTQFSFEVWINWKGYEQGVWQPIFTFAAAAYNLVRMRNLIGAAIPAA